MSKRALVLAVVIAVAVIAGVAHVHHFSSMWDGP
jgi:hypothetical protein